MLEFILQLTVGAALWIVVGYLTARFSGYLGREFFRQVPWIAPTYTVLELLIWPLTFLFLIVYIPIEYLERLDHTGSLPE